MAGKKLRLLSWNVNGIRAVERKGAMDWLSRGEHDIVCLQETKVHDPGLVPERLRTPDGYHSYWNCSIRKKGYSGVATYAKAPARVVIDDFGDTLLSREGRVIETRFPGFALFNVYFPNGGRGKERVAYKLEFYEQFLAYVRKVEREVPVVFCGDVNTAHKEIDLARPRQNRSNTGFLDEERAWIDRVTDAGFVDAFRMFNQEPGHYTWWDYQTRARERNVGWRIDSFFVSGALRDKVGSAGILADVMGSDHAPVTLELSL